MRLSDCFTQIMAYVFYMIDSVQKDPPPFEQVKNDIDRLIKAGDNLFQEGRFSQEDYDLARFAVFVWIDEKIMGLPWDEKKRWQKELLQKKYYGSLKGGIEFFERLNLIGPERNQVREVYLICLLLGFSGRYRKKEDILYLNELKSSCLKILTGDLDSISSIKENTIFPEAYRSIQEKPKLRKKIWKSLLSGTAIWFFCLPAGLYAILFIIYRFLLSGQAAMTP